MLVIAPTERERLALELLMEPSISCRSIGAAADTEGVGIAVIVIGGAYPTAEFIEVRAHPMLFDKPIVLFAPGKRLHEQLKRATNVWLVDDVETASSDLVRIVGALLSSDVANDASAS